MSQRDPITVYDARWLVSDFDDTAVRRLFEATYIYGRQLGTDTVTLARDGRLAGEHVMAIARDEALRVGMRVVYSPDPVGTPQSYFLNLKVSQEHPNTMGLTITASHNPSGYIGVKFTVPTVRAIGLDCGPAGGLTRIREIYHRDHRLPDAPTAGSCETCDVTQGYIEFSLDQAGVTPGSLDGIRVVIDGLNGSAGPALAEALRQAGAHVETYRIEPDGRFPDGPPNPTIRGRLDHAIAMAREHDCQLVIGLDGDGDRMVFASSQGLLSAGFAAIPILHGCRAEVRETHPPVLYDPKVNPIALAAWSHLGTRPTLFRPGHSQIKDYMHQVGALAAAEESGHYYHQMTLGDVTVWCENTILTVALLLESLRDDPTTLDRLFAMQRQIHTTGEFNYQLASNATRDEAIQAIVDHFTSERADIVTATPEGIDLGGTAISKGIRPNGDGLLLEPDWFSGYFRVATTEHGIVRGYFSAEREDRCRQLEKTTRDILAGQFDGRPID